MCNWIPSGENRIDPCLKEEITKLQQVGIKTLGSCCGHGKFPKTIVIETKDGKHVDYFSGVEIPRKKRFYFRDMEEHYFIPEVDSYYSHLAMQERCLNTIASMPFYIWAMMNRFCQKGTCENNCPVRSEYCAKGNLLLYASYRRGTFGNKVPPIFTTCNQTISSRSNQQ